MMNILSLDNSSQNLSVALKAKDKIFEENKLIPKGAEHIIPAIAKVLKKAKLKINKVDYLAVGLGPGSFTGLRVCLSIVKGFSLALKKPVVAIPSFEAIAEEFTALNKTTAVIFDARKDLVYAGLYKRAGLKVKALKPVRLMRLEEFLRKSCNKDCLFAGESVKFKERINKVYPKALIKDAVTYPKAGFLFSKAEENIRLRRFVKLRDLEPLYLHPETCQVRKRKK